MSTESDTHDASLDEAVGVAPPGDRRAWLEQVERGNVRHAALALMVIAVIAAVSHAIVLTGGERAVLTPIWAGVALWMGAAWLVMRRRAMSRPAVHVAIPLVSLPVLTAVVCQLAVLDLPRESFSVSLFIIGVGLFLVTRWWWAVLIAIAVAAWGVFVAMHDNASVWRPFAFVHIDAMVFSAVTLFIRRRHLSQAHALRCAERDRRLALKAANAELAASEQRFREFANHSEQVFWINDYPSGEMIYINSAYEKLIGRSVADLRRNPMDWIEPIYADDRDRVRNAYLLHAAKGGFDEEYRIQRPDGSVIWVHDVGFPIRDDTGKITRLAGIVTDITRHKRAEEDQRRLEAELRQSQKLEAVGTLAAGVAHDINNYLHAINGYAELAQDRLAEDGLAEDRVAEEKDAARQSIAMLQTAVDQAGGVIRALLTFAHRTPFAKRPVDLAASLRHANWLLRRLMPAGVELIEDLPAEPVFVNADENQLAQVWLNLAVNARDAMPDGGRLTVRLRRLAEAPDDADPSLNAPIDRAAVVTFIDTGRGMDDATLSRVFEPFFTTKPREKGTGLGLAISHGIVTDHGGRIRARSAPGAGARFTVVLPMTGAPAAMQDASAAPGMTPGIAPGARPDAPGMTSSGAPSAQLVTPDVVSHHAPSDPLGEATAAPDERCDEHAALGEPAEPDTSAASNESPASNSSPSSPGSPAARSQHVLIVDDNHLAAAVMKSTLNDAGFRVMIAGDGLAAVSAFDQYVDRWHLVVLDLDLPKQSGEACLEHIRRRRPDLPVILITGGVDRLPDPAPPHTFTLKKPFAMATLVAIVRTATTGNGANGE